MKNKLLIILFTLIPLLFSCNSKNDEYAKIECNNEINMGTIKNNDTIKKYFLVKNVSSNLLKIKQIVTSCGCTVAKLKDSTIEKNRSTQIEVQFIADRIKKGKINKSIILDANTKPNFTVLYLKGAIE